MAKVGFLGHNTPDINKMAMSYLVFKIFKAFYYYELKTHLNDKDTLNLQVSP